MLSSRLCDYQMKYFKVLLVTSSARHVHKTTRRPLEDQYRLQVDLKHKDVLMLSSGLCHYQITYFIAPLITSSTRHVHVDDVCALALHFKRHRQQMQVYLRKFEKTLLTGRIRIQSLLNTCQITYKTAYVRWHSKCSFRLVCIELKSRNHNMHVEQRQFRTHAICVQTH